MKFYIFEPQISGDLGEKTVYAPPDMIDVLKLHYEFARWPQDDLQWCQFCFIGTERLKQELEALTPPITGIEFDSVQISGNDQEFDRVWREGRPDSALGKWYWFKVTGKPGEHDFGQNYRSMDLVISERVAKVLESFPLPYKRDFHVWQPELAK